MKISMQAKLEQLERRLAEVNLLLSSEQAARDLDAWRRLNREHSDLAQVVDHLQAWRQAERDLETAEAMRGDPDLRAFADEEAAAAAERIAHEEHQLERLLLPKDPNDERNVILEIRAGTGGEESALFAAALLRMYLRLAERRRWSTEILSESASDLGGYREVIVRIAGTGVYSQLKFESGGHRVQRVPETEAQGRIHTSACTVAVMAEADETGDVEIDPSELRIDVYRASGAGGQHVNKTESAVRITHLPTGVVVACQDERSQMKNRAKALTMLRAKLYQAEQERLEAERRHLRRAQVGTGERHEKIRTYNFPQDRITDHRINENFHNLPRILEGHMQDIHGALAKAEKAERLAQLDLA